LFEESVEEPEAEGVVEAPDKPESIPEPGGQITTGISRKQS